MRFWVAVARNEGGNDERFQRTEPEDRIAVYSPRPKQCFTRIINGNVNTSATGEAPVKPLIESLDFIRNKQQWGVYFRRGFFEIPESDFRKIEACLASGSPASDV